MPAPSQALLTPEHEPTCESDPVITDKARQAPTRVAKLQREETSAHASYVSDAQQSATPVQPATDADLALRIKLEYERECYKQAEGRVRARLQKLQAWTADIAKTSNR